MPAAFGRDAADGHRFEPTDQQLILALAEHANLALNHARATEEAMPEAFHDALTGLPNRSLFLDRLEHALARVARGGRPVAVLFFDLDGFKTVNDSLGHAAGDELLRLVGERLGERLRPADTVARLGGDEFAVLLEELGEPGDAARAAARVLEPRVARSRSRGASSSSAPASGSPRPPGADADELLRNADLAMYRAKSTARAATRSSSRACTLRSSAGWSSSST